MEVCLFPLRPQQTFAPSACSGIVTFLVNSSKILLTNQSARCCRLTFRHVAWIPTLIWMHQSFLLLQPKIKPGSLVTWHSSQSVWRGVTKSRFPATSSETSTTCIDLGKICLLSSEIHFIRSRWRCFPRAPCCWQRRRVRNAESRAWRKHAFPLRFQNWPCSKERLVCFRLKLGTGCSVWFKPCGTSALENTLLSGCFSSFSC